MKIDELEHEAEDILTDDSQSHFGENFDIPWDGRWEYAFESLTERGSAFRRRAATY